MPKFRITAPDGKSFDVEGPEGSTAEQALAQVQAQYGKTPDTEQPEPSIGDFLKASSRFTPPALGLKVAQKSSELLDRAAYSTGGAVTDVTRSPALGFAANMGMQALPMLAGGQVAKAAAPALEYGAKALMQSALKPTLKQLKSGDAATAIDTMLGEGLNVTKGGAEKLREKIGGLNEKISQEIGSSEAQVPIGGAGIYLPDTLKKFANQVNPQADMEAVRKSWELFKSHPLFQGKGEMPVQLAQTIKQGTYKQLSGKYGELSNAETEAQKAIARGLKDQVAEAVPGISNLNQQESKLITTLNVVERRALLDLNKNPLNMALLAHSPSAFAVYMADKSALFKSLAARMLNAGKEQIPATGARLGIAGYETMQPQGQQP